MTINSFNLQTPCLQVFGLPPADSGGTLRRNEMKAIVMDHDMLLNAARLMEREGGSFAGHIARAFYVADTMNRHALVTAFDGLFTKYYRQYRLEQRRNEPDWDADETNQGESK